MTRKEWKLAGRKSFHRHYLILMFVCILLALFGREAGNSVRILKQQRAFEESSTILNASDVFSTIAGGDLSLGETLSQVIRDSIPDELEGSKALGTTNGVLAGFVQSVASGRFYVTLAEGIFSITKSAEATRVIFVLLHLAVMFAVWFFIKNILGACVRRLFLESRTYEKVPFLDIVHFVSVRKWVRACWTMFLFALFATLWWLTIIGGIIKHYSYYLVPYIVAENPSLKGTEAITLSRRMMDGHKWEAFVFDLSFIGWYLLSAVTFGLSDAFYGFPYRTAARAEYYVWLRSLAKEKKIEGVNALNDVYLYEVADKIPLYESYFDVVDMQTYVLENKVTMTKVQAALLKWLSIWFGSMEDKKKHDEVESVSYTIERSIRCRDGLAYPLRLNPNWKEPKRKFRTRFSFTRAYSIWSAILLFLTFGFIGWCWELFFYLMQDGALYNRGMLHGPWLPVYGSGGLIALLICSRFRKKPIVELVVCVVLCGAVEYLAAYLLETNYHERWWSYDGYFLNIQGCVCAEGLIVFGIACMLVVYLIAPLFDFIVTKIPAKILRVIAIGLFVVFLIDVFYSIGHPNVAEGAVESNRPGATAVVTEVTNP